MILRNNTSANFSGFFVVTLMLSGLDWFSPSLKLNSEYTGNTTFLDYHKGPSTSIGLIEASGDNIDHIKETFIDNVFYKPASPIVDLSMTYNAIYDLNLIGVNGVVSPYSFIFNIIPVD
jgi:hypothetical protein